MPATATTSGRVRKIATGEEINTWGDRLNTNFDLIDDQIDGFVVVPLVANTLLSSVNYADDQSRNLILKFTGAGPFTVTVPGVSKRYIVWNTCTAAVTLTAGAAGVSIDPNDIVLVICDGTDVKALGFNNLSLKDYIASVVIAATMGAPATAGNAGKYIFTDGALAFWRQIVTTDISDYTANRDVDYAVLTARAIAFAIAL
jgi:hypothetical protein